MAETLAPNHHAHHPGFAGLSGFLAAITFTRGRDADAALAIRLAQLTAGDRLVDIGSGPGVAARRGASLGAEVVAVDPSAMMLRVGRVTNRAKGLRYADGTAESLPVEDGWASVVWSIATVHHWGDIDDGLREVRRILRPGGRFVVLERQVVAGATGLGSHGWTIEQAEAFASACREIGFGDVAVEGPRQAGRRTLLAVTAIAG